MLGEGIVRDRHACQHNHHSGPASTTFGNLAALLGGWLTGSGGPEGLSREARPRGARGGVDKQVRFILL